LVLIDDMPDYCGTEFRFRYKPDFRELFELPGFPQYLELSNGGRMLSETAFMWTVRRLASTANVAEILAPCAVACPVCARATSFIRHTPAKPLTGEI
jgi:hypothetical protein